MKIAKAFGMVAMLALLASCGGGGDEAGDAEAMSVSPAEVTWGCKGSGGGLSVHTINGGQRPFRIHNAFPQFITLYQVQVIGGVQQYIPFQLQPDSSAVLDGKDAQFAAYLDAPCESEVSVIVYDFHSQSFEVSLETDTEDEETTPTP